MPSPEIAIIDPNTLSSLGLCGLLEELIPGAVIRMFPSFAAFADDTPDMYAHYFVSAQVYFEHTVFFLPRRPKTIVLAAGEGNPQLAGVLTLNICQPEKDLVRSIVHLHGHGHKHGHPGKLPAPAMPVGEKPHNGPAVHERTAGEIKVRVRVEKALCNKEKPDRLNTSLPTATSPRKNITEKLGIKSVSGLTIYAVMHGYVEADAI